MSQVSSQIEIFFFYYNLIEAQQSYKTRGVVDISLYLIDFTYQKDHS